jgi:hypothetical protein
MPGSIEGIDGYEPDQERLGPAQSLLERLGARVGGEHGCEQQRPEQSRPERQQPAPADAPLGVREHAQPPRASRQQHGHLAVA